MRLVLIVLMTLAWPVFAEESPRVISVSGSGQVAATPDMAELTIGVRREARRADDALDSVSEGVAGLFLLLDTLGIEAGDRRTSALSLQPRWERSSGNASQRVIGYVASNQVTVRVRDLDVLGSLISDSVGNGGNQLSGLRFTVADPAPLEREARRLAVLNAIDKATLYAEAAGVALGDLLSMSDGGAVLPRGGPMMAEMALRSDAMPIAEGEIDIRATVSMIYAIAE